MSQRLAGRRCIVTGASSGIGRAIAVGLGGEGARVALCARRAEALEETAALVRDAGGEPLVEPMDVTDRTSVAAAVAAAVDAWGGVDVLVNNAGAGGPNGCATEGPDRWDEIVRTNLDGLFHVTRAVCPHLAEGGRVINVSSVLGRFGVPGYTAYCASKHGVIGFTKALALELAPRRITANAICPGWVDTEMARAGMELIAQQNGTTFAQARGEALAQVPIQRILEPGEIGALCVYLAGAESSGMTAQAVSLCGGATMI